MVENKSKQLTTVLNALNSLSPSDVFNFAAHKIDVSQKSVEQQVADAIEFDHPYIPDLSQQFASNITPILQGLLLSVSQQALEKGHQDAMVQYESVEDEHIKQLETQLNELKIKSSKLETDNLALEDIIEAKDTELELFKSELGDVTTEQDNQVKHLTEQLNLAELQLAKQKEQNEAQSTKLKQLIEDRRAEHHNQDSRLTEVKKVFTDEIESLKSGIHSKNNEVDTLNQQLKAAKGRLSIIGEEHQLLSQETSEHTKSLQSMLESKEATLRQLNTEKERLEGFIKEQAQSIENLELKNKTQHSDIDEQKALVNELELNLAKSSQESEGRLSHLKQNLSQETEQLKEKIQAQSALISDEAVINQGLKDKLTTFENTKQSDLDTIAQLRRQLEMQDNALNREQQRNNSLVNRIEKDSQQVRGAYESIRSENIELTDRVEELEAKVTEFKLKFEYAQKQLTTD
jgi:chromosome segregation ATPase